MKNFDFMKEVVGKKRVSVNMFSNNCYVHTIIDELFNKVMLKQSVLLDDKLKHKLSYRKYSHNSKYLLQKEIASHQGISAEDIQDISYYYNNNKIDRSNRRLIMSSKNSDFSTKLENLREILHNT